MPKKEVPCRWHLGMLERPARMAIEAAFKLFSCHLFTELFKDEKIIRCIYVKIFLNFNLQ